MANSSLKILLFTLLFGISSNYSQVVFRDLRNSDQKENFSAEININSKFSEIVSLNGKWEVYPFENPEKKFSINVPSYFEGDGEFIFKKKFRISAEQIRKNKIELIFQGLNYSADISINNALIYRHTGGDIPFSVPLPRDILFSEKENVLQVSLKYEITPETTIPINKRFFFPKNYGGIFRNVFLKLSPSVNIQSLNVNSSIEFSSNRARVDIDALIENKEIQIASDTLRENQELFTLSIQIISPDGKNIVASEKRDFQLKRNKEINIKSSLLINSPSLWSPNFPVSYLIRAEIIRNGAVINDYNYSLALFELRVKDKKFKLNNSPFKFHGVTYVPTIDIYGPLTNYEQIEDDIKKIKLTGFNSVRFIKSIPPLYVLRLCEIYGLIPIIDLPLADLPEGLSESENFRTRVKDYSNLLLKAFNDYSLFVALNLGSSYLASSTEISSFLSDLASFIKQKKNLILIASFFNYDVSEIKGIDLYGIELFNNLSFNSTKDLEALKSRIDEGRIFFSEATYTISFGQSDGYVNKFTYESQAKFFEDLIKYSENNFSGFFINSMFDYRGDFSSLFFKFDEKNIYRIGLISEDRKEERLAYKVVSSYLQDTERVTIPIGSLKVDAPMVFILTGAILAFFMVLLINSGKKFKEDAKRALLRPYNFFADVRDQRIISGYQSIFLLIIICVTSSLLVSNIIHYFRSDLLTEKLLLATGSKFIISAFSYLAWNPLNSIVVLSIFFLMVLFILMLVIKAAAFFVRNRVYVTNVFFVVVWSLLPLVLFIPVGVFLYRLLITELFNTYVFIFFILLKIWLIFRMIKGIYVIYDVNPAPVYFYSFVFILFILSVLIFYFELSYSLIDNLILVLKQFRVV
ncbi:MAG: hypothetical protein NZM09_03855 [Ignavibacterium sp.]|nr:hypothetical protein [Ignavibacterium sp.]MDW8374815.1 glycoside hydrolase family 2 TIM barrel-domain containing protein [Ignavibacteriales bacterium]